MIIISALGMTLFTSMKPSTSSVRAIRPSSSPFLAAGEKKALKEKSAFRNIVSCGTLIAVSSCAAFLFFIQSSPAQTALQETPSAVSSIQRRDVSLPSLNLFRQGMGNKVDTLSHREGWTASTQGGERKISKSGYDITPLTVSERQRWISSLTDFQKYVAINKGTERSFTGRTVNGYPHSNKAKGIYVSAVGELPVFSWETKYESGTGWPSFYAPIDPDHIIEVSDSSIPFMPRTEVIDARGGAHLGHVFNDGPPPTGKRYCLNAAALKFVPETNIEEKDS